MTTNSPLARHLGTVDAVTIGLGSMIGAGIFAAFAPAAGAAGSALLIGLGIAAVIAYCNAASSAQLAAQYPTSGGTYVYGRERLGAWTGFVAGWSFVIGKTASCAAMALTFAAYVAPSGWQKPVAVAGIATVAAINYFGVTRTARATQIIVAFTLLVLVTVVAVGLGGGPHVPIVTDPLGGDAFAILSSAGLLFFAFAGYARVATMGEEVKDPARTIPRAIFIALAITLLIYAAVAVTALTTLGPSRLAASAAPLVDVVTIAGAQQLTPVVAVGAAAASLGALLALVAGISRTSLAMARNGDLPPWLAAVHPRHQVPHHAELTLALVVAIVVVIVDLRGAIGFSSFGVLLYYFIANVAAFTQTSAHRRYPRAVSLLGASGCLVLMVTLPSSSSIAGVAVVLVGITGRAILRAVRR